MNQYDANNVHESTSTTTKTHNTIGCFSYFKKKATQIPSALITLKDLSIMAIRRRKYDNFTNSISELQKDGGGINSDSDDEVWGINLKTIKSHQPQYSKNGK